MLDDVMILGHLAISALLHRYMKVDLGACVGGGLAPDLVDKTLCQFLHITPSGRMYAHTLLGLGLSTAVVWTVRGKRPALGWMAGYAAHLVADAGGPVPWLYPLVRQNWRGQDPPFSEILSRFAHQPLAIGLEALLLLWAGSALFAGDKPVPRQGQR